MDRILMVCGKWNDVNNRLHFEPEKSRGCKTVEVSEDVNFQEFVKMVLEDFELDPQKDKVRLSYISDELMDGLPADTPPIVVSNDRQLRGYVQEFRKGAIRLCVEILGVDPVGREEVKRSRPPIVREIKGEAHLQGDVGDAECETRFDCCDDEDGASSDDEDFTSIQRIFTEEDRTNVGRKERDSKVDDLSLDKVIKLFDIAVGQIYPTKVDLEVKLKIYSVLHHFDFNVLASSKILLIVGCWLPTCTWRLRAARLSATSECFSVRVFISKHSCSVADRNRRSRQATPDILGRLYLDYVGGVGQSVIPNHVADSLNRRFGLKIQYWKAYRTLKFAKSIVSGTADNSFAELPSYLEMIRRANPGTYTKLQVDGQQRFKYLFVAFGASICGMPFMRKVVVVDGTFLQGQHKGTLLTAAMQDGNFQIFPIAFAVVDNETDESWEWFFIQLNRIIPDDPEMAIISDRHLSIGNAIKKVYPRACRGICTYHLRKNILLRFKGGVGFKLFKKAATAYRLAEFNSILSDIERADWKLYEYLVKADVCSWSRVHCPVNRYNFTTSNIAESLNKVLLEARSFPIVQLIDAIRALLTRWFAERRTKAEATPTMLSPAVENLLKSYSNGTGLLCTQKRVPESTQYAVQAINEHQAYVARSGSSHVVNLTERKCSCNRFDVDKIPCVHALAVAAEWKRPTMELTSPYYYTSYVYHAYRTSVFPKHEDHLIPDSVARQACRPPVVQTQPGRPKKTRLKSWLEGPAEAKRPKKVMACSICGAVGHNARTCKPDM